MSEENKTNESTSTGLNAGDNYKPLELIESANRAAERLEKANSKTEELLKQQEIIAMRQRLGGKTEGAIPQEVKVEDPVDYARRALAGKLPEKK